MINKVSTNFSSTQQSRNNKSSKNPIMFRMKLDVDQKELDTFLSILKGSKDEKKEVFNEILNYITNYDANGTAERIFSKPLNQDRLKYLNIKNLDISHPRKIFKNYEDSIINISNFVVNNKSNRGPMLSVAADLQKTVYSDFVQGTSASLPITKASQIPNYAKQIIDYIVNEVLQKKLNIIIKDLAPLEIRSPLNRIGLRQSHPS